ncbi:hypothetical protein [Pedobacter africanus]|uniref:Outer membrane protein beta-barrel domain-containing protein n=1 Tax=Pedobacter africanus TaxID=151894 RepID=A0A1W2BAG6_9SPHI|nr:hypothetical protein [Pedobacter africanus]SMC69977.1 hypothetical protein SAMN04488524_2180 [Pedobacter africanus]
MKPAEDELLAHIRESLTGHEEAYAQGAWERFEKREGGVRKGRRLLWLLSLSSAAAVLLIGFALFFTNSRKNPVNEIPQQAQTKAGQPQKIQEQTPSGQEITADPTSGAAKAITEKLNTPIAENKAVVAQRQNNNVPNSPLIVASQLPSVKKAEDIPVKPIDEAVKTEALVAALPVKKPNPVDSGLIAKTPPKADKPRSFQEFLEAEVKANPQLAQTKAVAKKSDKWEMGVMVAPSIGNSKKLNMGYGVSMAYALSDKVSIGSGVSYSEMGATKDMTSGREGMLNNPSTSMAMVAETKNLQSVDASLVGLDIPLEIKYHFTRKLYTNFGVSAFAILNQKQRNNYLQGSVETLASADVSQPGFNAVFSQRSVSEPVPTGEIRNNKYLGFYNISFGYKQSVSEKQSFSVEPFMKLPMKEFSKENLYLIGTGIRLKFDF